jgi:hypothetical protein
MPDDWENARGLDVNNPSDATKDRDNDGYTNVEEYINSLPVDCINPLPGEIKPEDDSAQTESSVIGRDGGPQSEGDGAEAEISDRGQEGGCGCQSGPVAQRLLLPILVIVLCFRKKYTF